MKIVVKLDFALLQPIRTKSKWEHEHEKLSIYRMIFY